MTQFDRLRPAGPPDVPERHRHRRDARASTPRSARSACARRARKQYLELKDDFADFYEVDPYTPVATAPPIDEDIEVAVLGGGHHRPVGRRIPEESRRRGRAHHRDGRRLRRRLVLESLPGHPVRQRRLLLHPDAGRTQLPADQEVRRRRRDLRALPGASQSISGSTTARSSPPRSARRAGTRRSSAGG